ncbi:histidine phosphatase family protein [bacterium]|nr:histidine phosphatase family protein [bacterium]
MPLYLVRHGETDWNREKRFQSRTDIPLNERGIAQAAAIRAELDRRGVRFDLARSSPLGRAQHTARIILEGTGLAAEVEPAFIEVDFGGFEGRLEADLRAEYGPAYTAWRESQYTAVGPAGGESILTAAERVRGPLRELAQAGGAGNVLIVAHQAINMALKVALSGLTDVDSAATFRQNNNEVDIWDAIRGRRLEQFGVD